MMGRTLSPRGRVEVGSAAGSPRSGRGRIPLDIVERYLARPEAVRAWAKDKNLGVGERGRIPAELTAEYLARFGDLVRHAA